MNFGYNNPYFNQGTFQPLQPNQSIQQPNLSQMQPLVPRPPMPPMATPEANITSGGFKFSVYKDEPHSRRPTDLMVDDDGEPISAKKKRARATKKPEVVQGEIVKAESSQPEVMPTMFTYQETTDMLRGTLAQVDQLASQVKRELDNVTASRTLRNKYNVMVGLSDNLGALINTKISAIKEINNAISKSNDMDYRREKDRKASEAGINDDKYLMDLYNAFIQNPAGANSRALLGPSNLDATLGAGNIIRAATDDPNVGTAGFVPDNGFLGYVANMTPEQRLMAVEDNPNIKQCVVFDAATGNKAFQMIDMSTGQAIPGLPVRDQMFMEDTTINVNSGIAKNINLNETYPLIVINKDVTKDY